MKHWIKYFFVLCMLVMTMGTVVSANSTYGDFTYQTRENGTVEITDFPTSFRGDVVVPSTIENMPVTAIGAQAFRSCSYITSISLPDSITTIGAQAFYSCRRMTSINIPQGVTWIGPATFYGCTALGAIHLPSDIYWIGDEAFSGCTALQEVNLPSGLTHLGAKAFYNCSAIKSITLPSGLTRVEEHTFFGCSGLTQLTFTPGLTSIEKYGFWGCAGLTSLSLPSTLTSIGDYAFSACRGLTQVHVPQNVTELSGRAFANCTELTSVTLPAGLKALGEYCFTGCTELGTIYFQGNQTQWDALGVTNALPSDTRVQVNASVSTPDVEVPEVPVTPEVPQTRFTDVFPSDWFYDDVMEITEKGVMVGTTATLFSPSGMLTRGMMVDGLYRIAGSPTVTGALEFSDVSATSPYKDAIIWASTVGVTNGTGDGTFSPGLSIDREQMATMLQRYCDYQGISLKTTTTATPPDKDNISSYALDSVLGMYRSGILKGDDAGYFNPKSTATRGSAAALFCQFLDAIA